MAQGCQTANGASPNERITRRAQLRLSRGLMLASPPASCAPRTVLLAPVKVPHDYLFSAIPVSLWGAPFLSCSITLLLTHSNTHTLSLPCARSLSCSLSRTRAISLSRSSGCRFAYGFSIFWVREWVREVCGTWG